MSTTINRSALVSKLFGFGLAQLVAGCFIASTQATVLTMDVRTGGGAGTFVSNGSSLSTLNTAGYGSSVTASDLAGFQTSGSFKNYYGSAGGETPNIVTSWSDSLSNYILYNDANWPKVIYPAADTPNSLFVTFNPSPTFGVTLTSFTLRNYNGVGNSNGGWRVRDTTSGGTILTSATLLVNSGNPNPTLSIGYTGLADQTLVLEYYFTSGNAANVAFDNLQFSQIAEVPEPNSLILLSFGMTAFLTMRRKRAVVLEALSARSGKITSMLGLGLVLVILGGFDTPAYATRLTMDVRNGSDVYLGNADMVTTHSTYGSNVTATSQTSGSFIYHYGLESGPTPNIATTWLSSPTSNVPKTYDDPQWTTVVWMFSAIPNNLFIAFTPAAGFAAKLESFTVDNYSVGSSPTQSGGWTVHDALKTGPSLATGSWSSANVAHDTIARSINYTGNAGQTLVLEIFQSSGSLGQMGYDNVIFSQVAVPEPNSLTLTLFSFAAFLKIRRRPIV
jgi:hypothetical protein